MDRRKNYRFDKLKETVGEFYNHENFLVKNISLEGINLISNFRAVVGANYVIYLENNNQKLGFEIHVLRAEVHEFNPLETQLFLPGILYSIGARFVNLDAAHNKFVIALLETKFSNLETTGGGDPDEWESILRTRA